MIRVIELAIISIVLAVGAILGFLYLKNMYHTAHEAARLSSIIHELEDTFILLKSARYRVCLDIASVVARNSTIILNGKVLIIQHAVKIYIGNMHCSCIWYRSWLCFNPHKLCGIIDLSRLKDRYYIVDSRYLCGYVSTWIEKVGSVMIVYVS